MLRIKQNSHASSDITQEVNVPLKKVSVDATIHSFAADVTITQVFRNDETKPIEAVYCFPIEEKAAIYSCKIRIDDREIITQLKEKQEAQKEYNDALREGHGAYLLEQNENSQDNFIINVGSLLPSNECHITISYITELEFMQGSTIRFVIPTTIAPRYNPNKGGISSPAGTNSKYVQSTSYTIDFRCLINKMRIFGDEYITRINSSSHPIHIDFSQQDFYLITFAQENTHLDRDILINIELNDKRTNTIAAVESNGIMAIFTPTEEDCQQGTNNDQNNEFIFVIDCSGSMEDENKIGLARQAMLLFLKSLPINSYFNIIRFGSDYNSLFPEITAVYDEENFKKAERLIEGIKADLGGTELMKPLEWIQQHSPNSGRSRQMFLLTDGEISNVTEVLELCRSMASSTRIFSFGLGKSPSRSLVKGLARSTNGRFVFIPPNEKVDVYVGEQLQKALQPCITNIDIKWNLDVDFQCAPVESPPIYANDRLIIYAIIYDNTIPFDHNYSVELKNKVSNRSLGIAKINRIPTITEKETIARLAAKALILELQHTKSPSSILKKSKVGSAQERFQQMNVSNEDKDEQTVKERIIELSLKYNILSPYTAFVGIEKRINGNNDQMTLREVPVEISADDQRLPRSFSRSFGPLKCSVSSFGSVLGIARGGRGGRRLSPHRQQQYAYKASSNLSIQQNTKRMISFGCESDTNSSATTTLTATNFQYEAKRHRKRSSSRERSPNEERFRSFHTKEEQFPSTDEDIVRYLIDKQKYDGLWDFDTDIIMKLTGKPLAAFQLTDEKTDTQIIVSMIILILFETRFNTYSSLWHGIVQKTRKQINKLLGNKSKNFQTFNEEIRKQLN